MIVVTVAALALLGVAVVYIIHRERAVALGRVREHERLTRMFHARESDLLNRLAHAVDRPWTPPPVPDYPPSEGHDPEEELAWDASHVEDSEAMTF